MFAKIVSLSLLASLTSSLSLAQGKFEAGPYQIDPAHSKVGFEVPHLVISSVEGTFKTFEGKVDLADDFSKSKVRVTNFSCGAAKSVTIHNSNRFK